MWCRKTFTSKETDSRKGRTLGISSIRKSNMCGTRIKAWVMFSFSHYACIYGIFVVRFQNYRKLRNLDEHMLASDFHKRNKGLTDNKVQDRVQEFGANFIKISVPPILYLLFHEVQFPFSFITFDWRKLSFIGVESFLFVSSVYRDPLVYPDVLEVCCHHSHYLGHLRHRLRLGNTTSIKFDNFTDNLLKFLHIAKPKSTRQNEIGIASYGRS